MRNSDADRTAFYLDQASINAENARRERVVAWLNANPEIGVLNGNKYYIMEDGEQVFVSPPNDLEFLPSRSGNPDCVIVRDNDCQMERSIFASEIQDWKIGKVWF